ncbi:MAG: type II toxin-antitoxin system VapC family toxin [Acidimicrobiales bacterium]
MILPDVNVLVYVHHADSVGHREYRSWWEEVVNGPAAFALADLVLLGFVRVITHPKVFDSPMVTADALAAAEAMRDRPNSVVVHPGRRHWSLFTDLCRRTGAKGNAVPDAFLAALAIESGSEFVTADRGFARFPGLRWRHPLDVDKK